MKDEARPFAHGTTARPGQERGQRSIAVEAQAGLGSVLPDANGGFQPCPELLTEAEAVRYLRLDLDGPSKPALTLRYYREKGLLRATRVGRRLRYRRVELDRLLVRLSETQPSQSRSDASGDRHRD